MNAQTQSGQFEIKSVYRYAIQEDVKTILEILDTVPVSSLSTADFVLKENYFKRFKSKDENFDYGTEDKLLRGAIDIYKNYWSSILLKEKNIEQADSNLINELKHYLNSERGQNQFGSAAEIENDPMKYFSALLTSKGFFNNVDGKTGNLYDIYIWKTQDTLKYQVDLPDGVIEVPVLFMKDIITLGWEEYATFGGAYPGGWPRDGSLFCVAKAYDTSSEKFLVSYLAHESQHFLDLRDFPGMPSWQLEYRAKLAEIFKSDLTQEKLISNFIKGAKNDSSLSHPYAEYLVISELSNKIFNENFIPDISKWKEIEKPAIKSASEELLKQSTEALKKKY